MPKPVSWMATADVLTEDRLLGGRVVLVQPSSGYRAAIDPVLLAAAALVDAGQRVVDLGCGVGAAALCLAARVDGCALWGLERQPDRAVLARDNAARNGVADRLTVVEGEVAALPASLPPQNFDHVISNPPYMADGIGTLPECSGRMSANWEGETGLSVWLAAARRLLRPKGWLTLVHRADRVDELCAMLHPAFGAVTLIPLWPKAGRPARRIIVRARLAARSPAVIHPGLVLHDDAGGFTDSAEAVLRGAQPL